MPALHVARLQMRVCTAFGLPLDYARTRKRSKFCAREMVAVGKAECRLAVSVFFQGGPHLARRDQQAQAAGSNVRCRSFACCCLTSAEPGCRHRSPRRRFAIGLAAQADYLQHFRADNIVRDAEAIRRQLIGDKRWTVLGQSFGAFARCTISPPCRRR